MTTLFKNNDISIADYISSLTKKCMETMSICVTPIKINDADISIPTIETYNEISKYNYSINQLKSIAKFYKLKIGGNKNELGIRIYSFLYFSSYIIKIQKRFRGLLTRRYCALHGPASLKRNLCTNASDFISLEPIETIPFHQFLSYKDKDGFIYGFDIISLYNLYFKSGSDIKNPYNRSIFPEYVFKTIKNILHFSMILKVHINLHIEDDTKSLSNEKTIEMRTLTLFQNIDALGNYSSPQWFLSLNRLQLIKFVREMIDIWNYRSQLPIETKRLICPPHGDPFRNLSMAYIHTENNMFNVKKVVLEVLEKMVNSGADKDSKTLGAYYVLGALTLVNEDAALALPWLFQSMSYF